MINKDQRDQFWRQGAKEYERIAVLDGQEDKNRSFVILGNHLYAVNNEHQLWSYDPDKEVFGILGMVGRDVDYSNDKNETLLLMSVQVSAKKSGGTDRK